MKTRGRADGQSARTIRNSCVGRLCGRGRAASHSMYADNRAMVVSLGDVLLRSRFGVI